MQPKCSTTNTSNPSTSTSTGHLSPSLLHIPVERFKDTCLKYKSTVGVNAEYPKDINSVLDYFFDPRKNLNLFTDDLNTMKLYLTGGYSFEAFKAKLKVFDTSSVCGLVWNVNYVAYRCRTCALSPCMSICAECFRNGDHQGHDFNMFRSGAGGACDCGDECVMNPKGFCKSHAADHSFKSSQHGPPDELIKCAEIILSNLLYSLLQQFRSIYATYFSSPNMLNSRSGLNSILDEIQPCLDVLNELCSMGTPMRQILVDYMISEEFYQKKIQAESAHDSTIDMEHTSEYSDFKFKSSSKNYKHSVYENSLAKQQKIIVPKKFENITMDICNSNSKYMVDEFLYWCIRFEFPENLVKFLLSLLPNISYKQIFIKSFVSQYSFISILLLNSKSENLSSRVVHISVQLFSNEAIAMKAVEENNLLPIILSTLYNMIVTPYANENARCLMKYNSDKVVATSSDTDVQLVVDPDHTIMHDNLYWLVISDLVNLLSHRGVALKFLNDMDLVELWLELISYFQGMNLNNRTFGDHIQHEPAYFSSFSAELEFCSSVMWSFLQHLKEPAQLDLSKKVIDILSLYLHKWLMAVNSTSESIEKIKRPSFKQLTFHLPLHRYLSSFIYNAIYQQADSADYVLKLNQAALEPRFLIDMLAHPLQLQIGFHEIHANMWVRNGMQMKGQAMTYVQNHFCTSFSDADLFQMQLLASKIDPSLFMKIFLERFHLFDWLKDVVRSRHQVMDVNDCKKIEADSIIANVVEEMLEEFNQVNNNESDKVKLEPAHQIAMLVGALTVLTQIIMIKPNLSFKSYSLTRTECVNLLCVFDRTFSQIEDSMPDMCSLSSSKKFIQPILNEVAEFLQPSLDSLSIGSLKQGRYKPKDSIWLNEYDPLYVMLRSVKRREFQESFDRYCQFIEKKIPASGRKKNLWPPFRLPTTSESPCYNHRENLKDLEPFLTKEDMKMVYDERNNQLRIDKELEAKANILNTKSLHAILLTILYEHYYTQPVAEKIFYFLIYILELSLHLSENSRSDCSMDTNQSFVAFPSTSKEFDELDYETWFKSNEIIKNLSTFVPFVFTKYELVSDKTSSLPMDLPVSSVDRLNLAEDTTESKVPPLKKMCSGIPSMQMSVDQGCSSSLKQTLETPSVSIRTNAKTGEKYYLKKTRIFESILSLLVKIYYRNQIELLEKQANSSNISHFVEFEFLKSKSAKSTEFNRIGDENDFILNLLEKSARSCEKCKLNIEKSLDTLNNLSKKPDVDLSTGSFGDSSQGSADLDASKLSPSGGDDELKNKKIKARARQQKLLAQMSSNQKAFLQNPNNKLDVEGFKDIAKTSQSSNDEPAKSGEFKAMYSETSSPQSVLTTNDTSEESHVLAIEESYDCCICRLSSTSSSDRPIGAVTLLQSTSVLGHRENKSNKNHIKKLPLSDELDYKLIETDSVCWKQEEKRVKNLRDSFSLSSCKYSINIGWKGGVYAQMCGHYLHFDCYNSYKKTLDDSLSRSSNADYACPLCRQLANCVLPVLTANSKGIKKTEPIKPEVETNTSQTSLISSTVSNSPAKLWILSSLLNKQQQVEELNLSKNNNYAIYTPSTSKTIYQHIHTALKFRSFSTPELSSKILTQCKNDALAIITLTTPLEFRYIDHCQNFLQNQSSPIDDDIAMFTMSVLRTQLEIDLMLKQHDEILSSNTKKRRACFVPLYDVISTHCRLMCHEHKPHVKLWSMLTNSSEAGLFTSDYEMTSTDDESNQLTKKTKEVPVLLKDPVAALLLILVNLPTNIQKNIFQSVVATVFNLTFVQSMITLCRDFDDEERMNWSSKSSSNWSTFQEFTANLITSFKNTNVLNSQVANIQNKSSYMKTIWTLESAKNYVKTKCIHFLKISSLLQYYLYDQEVSFNNLNSFDYLVGHLKINFDDQKTGSSSILTWSTPTPASILNHWIKELIEATETHQLQVDNLLKLSYDEYHLPQLLELPYLYSDLFGYYSTKACQFCSKIPKETGICLLCGVQICYKTHYCCDSMRDFNKKHLNMCGAGTLVILNINSTYVFIVRGKRCAPWASLYLDEHGEEDRDLRRGKPLYLNKQRYDLLQSTWCNHSFDYQSLKWYNISLFIYSN